MKINKNLVKKIIDAVKPVSKDNRWYETTYAEFSDGLRVYDRQVAEYTKQHLRFIDRFNLKKVVAAANWSFSILSKSCEAPSKDDNWKYFIDV